MKNKKIKKVLRPQSQFRKYLEFLLIGIFVVALTTVLLQLGVINFYWALAVMIPVVLYILGMI